MTLLSERGTTEPEEVIAETSRPRGRPRASSFKRLQTVLSYALAGLLPTILAWVITFRELTPVAGWVTFPLQDKHWIPYRDYFNPVAPLTYFEAHITASTNYGIRNYALLTLCVVPLFGIACFALARRFLGNLGSLLMVIVMAVTLISLRLEEIGGWNTQFVMLMSIGSVLFIAAVLSQMDEATRSDQLLKTRVTALLAGFFFSLAMIEKQTCLLSLVFIVILLVPWMYWERKEGFVRYISTAGLLAVVGAVPVSLFTLYWLVSHQAFGAFVRDMGSGGGKNPHFLSFFSLSLHTVEPYISVQLIVIASFMALYFTKKYRPQVRVDSTTAYWPRVDFYIVVFLCSFLLWRFSGAYQASNTLLFLLFNAAVSCVPVLLYRFGERLPSVVKTTLSLVIVLSLPLLFNWRTHGSWVDFLTRAGTVGTAQISLLLYAAILSTVVLLPRSMQAPLRRQYAVFFKDVPLTFSEFKFIVIFANILSVAVFVNVFSSGGGMVVQWFIPQGIVYFSIIWLIFKHLTAHFPLANFAAVGLILISVSLLVATFDRPYDWFNWGELSVFSAHTSSSDLPRNAGFQMSVPEHDFYVRIRRDALKAASLSGRGKNATVFSYPSIEATATATGLKDYKALRCVLLWFDLCPNKQAAADLVTFQKVPPNVIIWETIPPSIVEFNEGGFVHGRSALEDWEAYRVLQVSIGKWKLVDGFVSPLAKGWPVYVYAVVP